MSRIFLAFRCFFNVLFQGNLSDAALDALGLSRRAAAARPAAAAKAVPPKAERPAAPAVRVSDGALQMLAILQRDSRLVDFLMEDIAAYSDEQVGAAVRGLHGQSRESLARYVALEPVIDGVEGTFTKAPALGPSAVKFIGNVPSGTPSGGVLRHKGWRASKVDLPALSGQDVTVVAPAEIEIE